MNNREYINIYWYGPYDLKHVLSDLTDAKTEHYRGTHILDCPGVKAGLKNVYMICSKNAESYSWDIDTMTVIPTGNTTPHEDLHVREPYFKNTFFFTTGHEVLFFADEPLLMTATAPYFHSPSYLGKGMTISGEYDIGKWARPLQQDIICNRPRGEIVFNPNDPIYYFKFHTDKKLRFIRVIRNGVIDALTSNLVFDPRRKENRRFGPLAKRYDAFYKSDYWQGLLNEMKDAATPDILEQ